MMGRILADSYYEALKRNEVSPKDFCAVLQISLAEKQKVERHIQEKIEQKGIGVEALLGSNIIRGKIGEIIQELKNESAQYGLFNRALKAGELVDDVDLAIRKLIYSVNTARKHRHKRAENRAQQGSDRYSSHAPDKLQRADITSSHIRQMKVR